MALSAALPHGGGPDASADDLLRARAALLSTNPRQRQLTAEALRAALADLYELWLTSRCAAVGVGCGSALIAVGALGRREVVPYSDLDLVLLHDGKRDVAVLANALWYPLWDARIDLDHSVRTVGQAVQVAATDLRAALGLLDARLIAGDAELFTAMDTAVRRAWRTGIRSRLEELAESAQQRWLRSGDIAHRVEPDLKNGHGGLRDVQLLDALSAGQLVDRAGPDVCAARDLLLDVRTELHRFAGRGRDVLRAQEADEVAAALALGDRFDLARSLSGAARTVVYAVDVGLRTARAALPPRGRARLTGLRTLGRGPLRRPLDDGVVEHSGQVALARDANPARDPALALRVAATAARTGMPVATGTLTILADTAPELRRPWPRSALDELLSLLGAGPPAVDVIEAMDRTGLWGRLFPEWGAVRDLPPRDRAHVWTVDRHLVEAAARAARLTTTVARPDLLLLGALLHDLGKGRGGDHSSVGAALAEQIGHRLGLPTSDVETLCAMVRHHLLLPHAATRRDLDDPATVQRVVDTLGGDPTLLELLVALAEADGLATGPGVWTEWRAGLISDLAERCRAMLAGRPVPAPEPLTGEHRALAERAIASGSLHVAANPPAGPGTTTTIMVVTPGRPGVLALAAGVLALHSLQVHSADIRVVELSGGSAAVDSFTASPRFGRPPDAALLRQDLMRALDGSLQLADALAAKERDYGEPPASGMGFGDVETKVLWCDDEATGAVVLELRTTDRIGLLYRVVTALESKAVTVRWARVVTLGSSVVDSFGFTGPGGPGVLPPEVREQVELAVLSAAR
ncbi:MAG: [protein-PII] uridylyltransferase [Pseudonocardiales bacterium]|nr:[protein-PII] uridylyltransferase [Pseudonocardiales bacterium]MBV9730630.1 [protein-PII] uridylyltransferase [Pseudonocardiales bacterium]